jgi:hypothetical protein
MSESKDMRSSTKDRSLEGQTTVTAEMDEKSNVAQLQLNHLRSLCSKPLCCKIPKSDEGH